ncbi:MAG: hypothetical protein QF376_03025 [Anaerolineales bacterium]|nr:hypothetical protein [Anaerolineales bacterium]
MFITDLMKPDWVEYHRKGVDEPLIAAVHGARESVDVVVYDLRLQSVIDALLLLSARGD